MPRYNYSCPKCTIGDYLDSNVDGLSIFVAPDTKDYRKESLVWEEIHGMMDDSGVKCPVCASESDKTFLGVKVNFMIPGNFALDKWQCKTLSHIHKLETDDPYAHMRESGEKDEKIAQFKKALRKNANWKVDRRKKPAKRRKKRNIDLGNKKATRLQ